MSMLFSSCCFHAFSFLWLTNHLSTISSHPSCIFYYKICLDSPYSINSYHQQAYWCTHTFSLYLPAPYVTRATFTAFTFSQRNGRKAVCVKCLKSELARLFMTCDGAQQQRFYKSERWCYFNWIARVNICTEACRQVHLPSSTMFLSVTAPPCARVISPISNYAEYINYKAISLISSRRDVCLLSEMYCFILRRCLPIVKFIKLHIYVSGYGGRWVGRV